MPEQTLNQNAQLEQDIRNQIERNRSLFESAAEDPTRQIQETTLPWIVRPALREKLFEGFVDAPVGLGDNWGLQQTYNLLGSRAKDLIRAVAPIGARNALGYNIEPWRENPIIPKQHRQEILELLISPVEFGGQGKNPVDAMRIVVNLEKHAKERVPLLSKELTRARDELSTVRRVIYQWWAWRNAASGQEVGQDYLDSKMAVVARYDDFQKIFALPATFMADTEVVIDQKDAGGNVVAQVQCPGYPNSEEISELAVVEKFTEERERKCGFGELVQQETRLMNYVALADQPEEIMKWKLQAETKKLHEILETKGVSGVYLFLKRKGINYNDPDEEVKIAAAIEAFTDKEKNSVNNAFWKQFGYETPNLECRDVMGFPEVWIPLKARRGVYDRAEDSPAFFEPDSRDKQPVNREERINGITAELRNLMNAWSELSPLNNKTAIEQAAIRTRIEKITDQIRALSTSEITVEKDGEVVLDEKGKPKTEIVTILPSLQLEKELKLRGSDRSVVVEGCVWARPQMAKDKVGVMNGGFLDAVGGNNLAYEEALAISGVMGIQAKWGYYARDYNPDKHDGKPGYSPGEWQVDVEAWPYTSEWQNILAFPWHQQYKVEAGGPDGSRGRFGPLMTDYLTAHPVEKYDDFNNKLYVVVDKNRQLKFGRPDEGVVICDTAVTLMDYWHEGGDLANPEPWGKVVEDPFRRFKLRGFFAAGKTVIGGGELLTFWKKRDWKLEELDTDKAWDDYKLARRVALREELFEEDVWKEVVAPIDDKYKQDAAEAVAKIKAATTEGARVAEMRNARGLYKKWRVDRKKEVYAYSDQMFWNGIMSISEITKLDIQQTATKIGEHNDRNPATFITNIVARATGRGITLFGKYSKHELPTVVKQANEIEKELEKFKRKRGL